MPLLGLLVGVCFGGTAVEATERRTVLLIGLLPPTSSVVRAFSTDPKKNPSGWKGRNWQGLGYDIHAYFPEFPEGSEGMGTGDFRIDYTSVYNDFLRVTRELSPAYIIGLGKGHGAWQIESRFPPFQFVQWLRKNELPSAFGEPLAIPPPASLLEERERVASLPAKEIAMAVNSLPRLPIRAWVDSQGDAGSYVCGFLGFLIGWYHEEHRNDDETARSWGGGFIHVVAQKQEAAEALRATLRALLLARPPFSKGDQ